MTYGIGALWLLVPYWLESTARYMSGSLWWVGPVNDCVIMTNPLIVWQFATNNLFVPWGGFRATWFLGQFMWVFYWMVGLQTVLGLLFVAMAVLGLRPMRGNSWPGGQPQKGWWSRMIGQLEAITRARVATSVTRNQLLITPPDRAPCGDDPMLWKERHTSAGGGLRWLGSRPMVLFFSVFLGCFLLDVSYPVLSDLLDGRWQQASCAGVTDALRGSSEVLAVLAMLGVAAAAAVSLTEEREQDTWTSLATTLLTPLEIVRAKLFGAVWSARRVGVALIGLVDGRRIAGSASSSGSNGVGLLHRSCCLADRDDRSVRVFLRQKLDARTRHDLYRNSRLQRGQSMADDRVDVALFLPRIRWAGRSATSFGERSVVGSSLHSRTW